MARSENNLVAVFQDTADAIRAKTGGTDEICPRDFADEIGTISTGTPSLFTLDEPSSFEDDGVTRAKVESVDGSFRYIFVSEDYSMQDMNEIQVVFSVNGVQLKLRIGDYIADGTRCNVTCQDSTGAITIYRGRMEKGTYLKLPAACTIVSFSKGLWHNNTFWLTATGPDSN